MSLSACGICGGTIEWVPEFGWRHVKAQTGPIRERHIAEPDDSHVSDDSYLNCDWCGEPTCDGCGPDDEAERALDEDADAYADRMRD